MANSHEILNRDKHIECVRTIIEAALQVVERFKNELIIYAKEVIGIIPSLVQIKKILIYGINSFGVLYDCQIDIAIKGCILNCLI